MITLALLGAAVGAVLFFVVVTVFPPKRSTVVQLGRYYAHFRGDYSDGALPSSPESEGLRDRVGVYVSRALERHGVQYTGLRRDLALTGRSFEMLMGRKVVGAVASFVGALLVLAALRSLTDVTLPVLAPLAVGVVAAAVAFVAPDVDARKEAARRRTEFLEQLSVYLDLVSLQMAAHAAAATALPEAAQRGGGWPMMLIRDTLFRARMSGEDEWTALANLGERTGVIQLRELGALLKLVSKDGAQVRSTLAARAASIRRAQLADEHGEAKRRDQSMRLAQVLIALGFMVFVGYPAFVNIGF